MNSHIINNKFTIKKAIRLLNSQRIKCLVITDKKKRLIFDGSKKLQVFNCDLHAKNCINEEFTLREYSKILGGKYIDVNNVEYIYIVYCYYFHSREKL